MPAVLVVAGAYSILGAGATGWAAFAAGTMIVSGVMARKSEIDGNKDAANGWMAVGSIASLGATFASPAATTSSTASNAAYGAVPEAGSGLGSAALADGSAANATSTMGNASVMGDTATMGNATAGTSKAAADVGWREATAANDARMAQIASNNLKVQAGAGLLQAAVGWQSGEEQMKLKREQIAEDRRLSDRQMSNTNNLVDLKVQTPTNLPNLTSSARRAGLIGATATTVKQGTP